MWLETYGDAVTAENSSQFLWDPLHVRGNNKGFVSCCWFGGVFISGYLRLFLYARSFEAPVFITTPAEGCFDMFFFTFSLALRTEKGFSEIFGPKTWVFLNSLIYFWCLLPTRIKIFIRCVLMLLLTWILTNFWTALRYCLFCGCLSAVSNLGLVNFAQILV